VVVGGSQQVGAAPGDVVGVSAGQGVLLGVRQGVGVAVGLVAGGDHHRLHQPGVDPAGLQHVVGPADVGLERRQRVAQGGPDGRLGSQVEHRVDLVLVDGALDGGEVLQPAVDGGDPPDGAAADQFALVVQVADQGHDVR